MRRTLIIAFTGLFMGVLTHTVYFQSRQPADLNSLDGQLAWMQSELQVSDTQLRQIKALHQASAPRLRALAAQVVKLQQELVAFENTRVINGQVDFIEFARFVEARRNVNLECIASTRQLVLASADLMTTEQRARYLGLMATSIPLTELAIQ